MLAISVQGIKCNNGKALNIVKFILTFNWWINSIVIRGDNHDNYFCVTFFNFH